MATLTIRRGHQVFRHEFAPPQRLSALLERSGQALVHPCGGRGSCGKCAVLLTGEIAPPTEAEKRLGTRLSCQAVLLGDAAVLLPDALPMQIEGGSARDLPPVQPMPGRFGAAIDVGTTTLALRLYDLGTGACLAGTTMLNPQNSVAADVISRIDAAMKGALISQQTAVTDALQTMLHTAAAQADLPAEAVDALVVTGNTTMLYLLTGRDPTALSRAPFGADCLFGEEVTLLGRRCYLPPCLHAFVGADTTCALLSSGMPDKAGTALLCDVGTNGEIALHHGSRLLIASTAAGPAFEGAGIHCGCGSIPGAIDQVDATADGLRIHTVGDAPPMGLCGSGLVDAIAALLEAEVIDETGAMDDSPYPLAGNVTLTQQDVRAVQLAKAAVAAGTESLLHAAGCTAEDVSALYLAGGFGSHLRVEKAAAIGLILPELAGRVRVIGNAALDGAALLLMDQSLRRRAEKLASQAEHIRLDGNPYFSQRYVENMLFGANI
ncbi:MAG: DUF4445 domain-containing protein [Clostridia bacterium]|nr:DUF4445 domain-containing protein [Clostridia bacterium]